MKYKKLKFVVGEPVLVKVDDSEETVKGMIVDVWNPIEFNEPYVVKLEDGYLVKVSEDDLILDESRIVRIELR